MQHEPNRCPTHEQNIFAIGAEEHRAAAALMDILAKLPNDEQRLRVLAIASIRYGNYAEAAAFVHHLVRGMPWPKEASDV